jgi:hypothetical protein
MFLHLAATVPHWYTRGRKTGRSRNKKFKKMFLHLAATVPHWYPKGRKTGRSRNKKYEKGSCT